MDSLLFLAYRKKLRTSLVCDSAEPRLHSFVDMVLVDGQASTTFCAYLRSRDASSVSIRPALPKRFCSRTPAITMRQLSSRQSANRDGSSKTLERSGCSAGSDPLSRLVDFINVQHALQRCPKGSQFLQVTYG